MDCAEARAALQQDTRADELAAHLDVCATCAAELDAALVAPRPSPSPVTPGALAQLELRLARERGAVGWLRARSPSVRVAFVAALVVAALAVILGLRPRDDLGVYPTLRMGMVLVAYGGLLVILAWQALRPLQLPPSPSWLVRASILAGLVAPVVLGVLPELPAHSAAALRHAGHELFPSALLCSGLGALLGVALFLAALAVDRGGDGSARRALLGCAAAGLGGNLGLQMFCPLNQPAHLLLGHATVGLVLIALYGLTAGLRLRSR